VSYQTDAYQQCLALYTDTRQAGKMDIQEQTSFFIGEWQVSPHEDTLSQDGNTVRLEPRAMEVLVYLASRPGEVVSRSDLENKVWTGMLVTDDAVTSAIIKLRKALGDNAKDPRFIATVPKRGYQLIAPVTKPAAGADEVAVADQAGTPIASLRADRARVALMVTALAVVAVLAWAFLSSIAPAPTESASPGLDETTRRAPSILVLPFENLSEDTAQEQFADGITEDIITDLSGLSNLRVMGNNTSFSYKGRSVRPQEVGAELGVDFVLEGSIRRRGETIRINSQLVDARTGFQKWAERYDRDLAEVFAVQDEVTDAIVAALAIGLDSRERTNLAHRPTDNLEAYEYFREGQGLAGTSTRENNLLAQAAYRKAIQADPAYGRAYSALAYTLAFNFRRGWNDAPMQTIDRALELARKAVELDSSTPQTYWSLGYVHMMRKEFELAEKAAARALDIAPNFADGYGLLALIKNSLGEAQTAVELVEKGMQLNPFYTWDYPYNLGRAYYTLGQTEKAITALEAAKTRNPNVVPIRLHLAASYVRAGRLGDAEWEVEEIRTISPDETLGNVARTHPTRDQKALAVLLDELREAGLPE
jgi:TolB-like protein/DNA-binding winged helix-turn-helix (wHTH) protein/Tfp pilus assembly protein PilF